MAIRAKDIIQRVDVQSAGFDRLREAFIRSGAGGKEAFDKISNAARRTEPAIDRVDNSVQDLRGSFDRIMSTARRLAGVLGAAFGIREIVRTADSFTEMENKIRNATKSAEVFDDVMTKLRQVSNETRTDVTTNAQAFVRFNLVMSQMGHTTDDTLRLIETLNKSLAVSGVSTQEASAGVQQLAQAFGSGRLGGDEFRSVMENLPPVAQALADELGVTIGQLRELAKDGVITSDVMARAIANLSASADRDFANIQSTISASLVVVRNEFGFWLNDVNKAVGATAILSGALLLLADNFEVLTSALIGVTIAMTAAFGPAMLKRVSALFMLFARNPIGILVTALAGVIAYFVQIREEFSFLTQVIDRFGQIVSLISDKLLTAIGAVSTFITSLVSGEVSNIAVTWEAIGQKIIQALDWIIQNFDAVTNGALVFAGVLAGASLVNAIGGFITLLSSASTAMTVLSTAIVANPFGLLVAAAIAVGAAIASVIYYFTQTEAGIAKLESVIARFQSGVTNVFERLKSGIVNVIDYLQERITSLGTYVVSWANGIVAAIRNIVAEIRRLIASASSKITGGVKSALGFAGGGRVWGAGSSTSDSIWARLSRGEYVIRAAAVSHYGQDLFDMLNNMMVPRFASGGMVQPSPAQTNMHPMTLQIGSDVFEGLLAPEHTASQLIRYSIGKQIKSAGRKPGWYR